MATDNRQLSGSDHFQLLLYYRMRKAGQAGNISRIEYTLESSANLGELRQQLLKNSVLLDVLSLGFTRVPFKIARWKKSNPLPENAVILHATPVNGPAHNNLLNNPIDPTNGLVRIDLFENDKAEKQVLISMHHALFDHRGMKNFVLGINSGRHVGAFIYNIEKRPWMLVLRQSFQAVRFAFLSTGLGMVSLVNRKVTSSPISTYEFIRFTEHETDRIEKNAVINGAILSKSVFYMAAAMRSIGDMAERKSISGKFVWLAAPHDMRKKGEAGHLIGNAISFLYFRLNRAELSEMKTAVTSIQKQLKYMIKNQMVQKQDSFLHLFRNVPLPVYRAMTDLASGGKVASLAFSDLGDQQFPATHILDCPITRTSYLPPVPARPGISIVCNKEHGKLSLTIGLIKGLLSGPETEELLTGLRSMLLSE